MNSGLGGFFCIHLRRERMANDPVSRIALVTAQAVAPSRTEVLQDREYVVIPAVLVRAQVLHNNLGRALLPAHEITDEWAEAWNNSPVLIDHPTQRGQPISGRDPAVLNSMGVGYVFGAHVEEDEEGVLELRAEVWLQAARVEAVQELEEILALLNEGKPVELSTGFPTLAHEEEGVFNGKEFDLVMHPRGTDHLAVFVEKTGACSVADGCGLGVNCSCGCSQEERMDVNVEEASTFVRLFRKLMGAQNVEEEEEAVNESDEEFRSWLNDQLREAFGGNDVSIWLIATFSDESRVVYERWADDEETMFFEVNYEITETDGEREATFTEPEKVKQEISYPPADEAGNEDEEDNQEVGMNKKEMIARLEELEDEELEKLIESHDDEGEEGVEDGDPEPEPEADNALAELVEGVNALRDELTKDRERLAALEDVARPVIEDREKERTDLVETLAGNDDVPYEEDELVERSIDELRRLAQMAKIERPVTGSWAGRGGPRTATQGKDDEPAYAPVRPYYETPAANGAGEES